MTTPWPPRRTARRPLAPRVAAPREPVDPARLGRRVVRRRAKGMDAGAVAAALEDARFFARQDFRHEDLAADARGCAELAEWERLAQMLAAAPAGTVYDPDTDYVVQAELAAEAASAAAREAELREAARVAARADELQALRELGTLEQKRPGVPPAPDPGRDGTAGRTRAAACVRTEPRRPARPPGAAAAARGRGPGDPPAAVGERRLR
ncbi:hypothetical protein [Streptomyces sp. NPDC021356]|uniref:hypothetical protein n=1 Tax=Streptomyces sp. NPDC021356 TaxID=3154900 RepID=UPI0033FC1E9F